MHDLYQADSKRKSVRPPPNLPGRVSPEEFRRSIRDHLLYTCVKDGHEVTTPDLYRAMAHSVRDRMVQRWLTTQRTYRERDAKHIYYLSSEFLTGRSLGLCLVNLGLWELAEQLSSEHGFDIDDVIAPRETRSKLVTALETLQTKRVAQPRRKHGNIPL